MAYIVSLQFIREYASKVDELVKDKIEAQNEVKSKEKVEKDLVAQQVTNFFGIFPGSECGNLLVAQ